MFSIHRQDLEISAINDHDSQFFAWLQHSCVLLHGFCQAIWHGAVQVGLIKEVSFPHDGRNFRRSPDTPQIGKQRNLWYSSLLPNPSMATFPKIKKINRNAWKFKIHWPPAIIWNVAHVRQISLMYLRNTLWKSRRKMTAFTISNSCKNWLQSGKFTDILQFNQIMQPNFEFDAEQQCANLVDLEKCCKMR